MSLPEISNLGNACYGCGACESVCPKGAISMVEDVEGFRRPVIDESACIMCHRCEHVCPAITIGTEDGAKDTFWAVACDDALSERSSSGGVFGLLAQDVLQKGGIVYGAGFADGCRSVKHKRVDSADGLDEVMRSKYLQAEVHPEIYRGIANDLKSGKFVLFCGTACQIAGVRNYLNERKIDTEKLLLVDVICHGVPSPLLWRRWLDYVDSTIDSEVDEINFRSKSSGWTTYSVAYFEGAKKVREMPFNKDWYMRAFLSDSCLRPSCYGCAVKGKCGSDVTLGDFWGVQSCHPEAPTNHGVSAVVVRSVTGNEALEAAFRHAKVGECSYEDILAGNPSLEHGPNSEANRMSFMQALAAGMPIGEMMHRWDFQPSLTVRVLGKIKSLVPTRMKSLLKGTSAK